MLDAARALAALCVLLEHWRNLFFVDYPQLASHRLLLAPLYVLASAGHQAVVVFFVLSGYLISASIIGAIDRNQWSWRSYSVHRLVRLWVVLLPGLLLTGLLDFIGSHLHRPSAQLLYANGFNNHMTIDLAHHSGWAVFFGNAAFLQNVLVPTFGSNGALWSLANEFWYYVLFPLALLAILSRFASGRRLLSAALFLVAAVWLPRAILFAFPIWLLGMALTRMPAPRLGPWARWIATLFYVPLFFAFARVPALQGPWADTVLGVLTAAWLWSLLSASNTAAVPSLSARAARKMAGFYFTLYVIHTPMLALCAAAVLPGTRWQPGAVPLLAATVLLLLVVYAAFGFARVTEYHTNRLRSWLENLLGVRVGRLPDLAALESAA